MKKHSRITIERLRSIWDHHGVFDRLQDIYAARVRQWDFRGLTMRLNQAQPVGYNTDDPESMYKGVFFATVFDLYPSGKFYTPWAMSNVTPAEALRDEVFGDAVAEALSPIGCWLENGQGDPCDVFICRHLTDDEIRMMTTNLE